ncbi:hypothetical protein [Streptomyces sp. NPDC058861]|uniref:hypothetical protein n=1 Tax=Streptomyces sp. NPDC058861 TaxID=3346653 RepID=UPI00369E7620
MTLGGLLTAAATGTAPIPATSVVRLWAAVADDRARMNLGGLSDLATCNVTLDTDDEYAIATVSSVLRYLIDTSEGADGVQAILRLCTTPACQNQAIGRGSLTRVCEKDLDTLVPGILPNAADDDITPDAQERAAAVLRHVRLNAWEQEIAEQARDLAGERRVLNHLRARAVHA